MRKYNSRTRKNSVAGSNPVSHRKSSIGKNKGEKMKIGLYNLEPKIENTAMMQVSNYHKSIGDIKTQREDAIDTENK